MTSADRTGELIREMLERRASAAPAWLEEETTRAVRRVRQRRASGLSRESRIAIAAMVGATGAVALLALSVASGRWLPGSTAAGSPSPSLGVVLVATSPPETGERPPASVAPAAEPTASIETLPADSIAVVTTAGDRLRVRTRPGLGAESQALEPLLQARTRMLVLGGPVRADGYDWFQVYADSEGLAGWVAAGKDDERWIRPGRLRCPESLDMEALYFTSAMDLLLCYGGRPQQVEVLSAGPSGYAHCDLRTDRTGCTWGPDTFARSGLLNFGGLEGPAPPGDTGSIATLDVAIATGVSDEELERADPPVVTLLFDHPDSADCRVADGSGRETLEPWQAELACRLQPVIEDVKPAR